MNRKKNLLRLKLKSIARLLSLKRHVEKRVLVPRLENFIYKKNLPKLFYRMKAIQVLISLFKFT